MRLKAANWLFLALMLPGIFLVVFGTEWFQVAGLLLAIVALFTSIIDVRGPRVLRFWRRDD